MKKIILSLFVMLTLFALGTQVLNVKADATVTLTNGASIRLDSPAGLRFKATVSEPVEGAKYGIVFANGEVAKENVVVGATGVVNAEVDELKEDNTYAVSMVGIPERAFFSDITARAYIKVGDAYTYSDSVVTRNIHEVAKAYKNAHPDSNEQFIDYILSFGQLNFTLNGGETSEVLPAIYQMGEEVTLPIPTRSGYEFLGWSTTEYGSDYITSISSSSKEEVINLYAQWENLSPSNYLYVGATREYKTITAALDAAKDGYVIVLDAGTYTLSNVTISKAVTIMGPNAGVHGSSERNAEAIIENPVGVIINSSVTFDGVKIVGSAYNQSTIPFYGGAKLTEFVIKNSVVTTMKTIFESKEVHTATDAVITYQNNAFEKIGQFFMWLKADTTSKGYKAVNFINNITYASEEFGGVGTGDKGNGMFSLRNTSSADFEFNVIGNYFVALANSGFSYFRLNSGKGIVKYNTFDNVAIYQSGSSTATMTYENNIYLNSEGQALTSAPSVVADDHGVADTEVLTTETERASLFKEWLKNNNYTGECKLTFVLNGGSVESTLPTEYLVGKAIDLPIPTKLGYRFLGYTTEVNGTQYFTTLPSTFYGENLTLYAQWEENVIYVGEDGDYQTIKEAVEAATEGTLIIVAAGTYAEDVEITKNGIVLQGANHGVAWNGTRSEETVVTSVTINANNVVVDGIKFSAVEPIKVSGNNNVLTNLIMGSAPTANNQSVIKITGDVDGLSLLNSSVVETAGKYAYVHYRAIYAADTIVVKNLLVDGNKFEQPYASSVYIDCIRVLKLAKNITISNNTFSWPGNNFTIFLGNGNGTIAENAVINIVNNTFTSTNTASGIGVRGLLESDTLNIVGNSFSKVGGNVLAIRGALGTSDTTTNVNANISNNAFLDTSTQITLQIGLENLVMENNYFFQDVVWNAVSTTTTNDAANATSALGGVVSHNVTFTVNNGILYTPVPTEFVEGVELPLAAFVPTTVEGYRFAGWYDNANFTGEKVTSLGSQKTDVTLYAKYEAIPTYKVTYVLGGDDVTVSGLVFSATEGTTLTLPTPTRSGYDFLGWSTVNGSATYITEITVSSNITVYANWECIETQVVTYVFNGGNQTYQDLAAVKADFDTDYKALTGQTNYSAWKNTSALGKVFTDSNHKWDWLLNYWAGVNTNSYGGKTNASQFIKMRDQGTCDDYYFFGVEITSWYQSNQLSVYGNALKSADYTNEEIQDAWWSYYSAAEKNTVEFTDTHTLPTSLYNSSTKSFVGWYDNASFTGETLTTVSSTMTVYAKWVEATPVSSVTIDNKVTTLKRFETLQLEWTINPSDAGVKTVKFASSNPSVVTVSEKGFLTALSNGTATITMTSKSSTGASDSFEVTVYTPEHFEAEYETESYVELDESINLSAAYYNDNSTQEDLVWSSLNQDVATVDANGKVTAVNKGTATIRVALKNDSSTYFDFLVTVIDEDMSDALKEVVAAHESNAFVRYDLGIGAGKPEYYADIFGSVSKLLYNHKYSVDEKYLEDDTTKSNFNKNELADNGIEFITVHYTGTMGKGADTDNIASNFASSSTVSIHYVTGNKGKYSDGTASSEIYKVLDHAHGAWHAGDSLAKSEVGDFAWNATGVPYDGCDLLNVKFTASDDFYFEINGKKTTVKLPSTYDYNGRKTNHTFNADGTISSITGFGGTEFSNRTPESFFNDQGFPIKVENGEYYLGTTWWCYSNVYEGRICGSGGNRNSIGIETCVDLGSDLWYTWQVTAQLVAHLMIECNLDISRVKGHHFFAGKDCPQPLLENNQEIWYKFIEMVQHEYELLTTYKDTTFTFSKDNDYSFVSENGRVTTQPEWTTMVSYTVTVNTNGNEEKITLGTIAEGKYCK